MSRGLGVLSIHLDGAPCAVGCPFCYLGARSPLVPLRRRVSHPIDELERAIARLAFEELAIAVSEPIEGGPVDEAVVLRLCAAAARRGRPVAITTTAEIVERHPRLLASIQRLNLSVDPWKIDGDAQAILDRVAALTSRIRRPGLELVAIVSLSTPRFVELLLGAGQGGGLLEALVDLASLDAVALNALKPPPPFCDRAFWLSTLARLRPLLDRALDRRLFLDCYVAARLLHTGGCPARPDLTLSPSGLAFRSCVYAAAPELVAANAEELDEPAARFVAPAACPFETRLEEAGARRS